MRKTLLTSRFVRLILLFVVVLGAHPAASARRVGVYCYMSGTGSEVFHDGNVEVRLVLSPIGHALVEVENLTDKVIFVDRGRSFAWVNGLSATMFLPSSHTETHTQGYGTVEHDIHHVTWISGESHTDSQTVYDRRILPVAPHGTAVVYEWRRLPQLMRKDMIRVGSDGSLFSSKCRGAFLSPSTAAGAATDSDNGKKFKKGDRRAYAAEASPLTLAADVQYSLSEDGSHPVRAYVTDYVSSIVVGGSEGVGKDGALRTFFPHAIDGKQCFGFRSGKSSGLIVGEIASLALVVAIPLAIGRQSFDEPDWVSKHSW